MASPNRSAVHIFCTVVDNYGDAGVCLRLARHYARQGADTTLVIDRPELIDQMMPNWRSEPRLSVQTTAPDPQDCFKGHSQSGRLASSGSGVCSSAFESSALTVIEAFQFDAPLDYRLQLEDLLSAGIQIQRIALDYLATESWAINHQGLMSPDLEVKRVLAERGLTVNSTGPAATRKWFAPSFDIQGFPLIHDDFMEATPEQRQQMRARLGATQKDDFLVMAFGYPDAPWDELKQAFDTHGLPPGYQRAVFWHPKGLELTQDEFDIALQACDLNFVRGEDSFVRAHWAAASRWQVPFVWQPYRQDGQAHTDKLNGWLDQLQERVGDQVSDLEAYRAFTWSFNGLTETPDPSSSYQTLIHHWLDISEKLSRFERDLVRDPTTDKPPHDLLR
jgi:hypothetical protein